MKTVINSNTQPGEEDTACSSRHGVYEYDRHDGYEAWILHWSSRSHSFRPEWLLAICSFVRGHSSCRRDSVKITVMKLLIWIVLSKFRHCEWGVACLSLQMWKNSIWANFKTFMKIFSCEKYTVYIGGRARVGYGWLQLSMVRHRIKILLCMASYRR